MEDTDAFGRSVNFVPERIVFGTAGGDLLKLLVGPLYANETKVGVRELVQNATDAVKELEQLISEGAIDEPGDRWPIESDVQVKFLRDEENEVTDIYVTDRGVGMSLPVVRDYFLKAGASLRSSDAWKKLHESADGSLKAQRTGRFGVGLLAAFLLGDKIEVTTRHYTSEPDSGLNLETGIASETINVTRTNCPVGTQIRIHVPKRLRKNVTGILPSRYRFKVSFEDGIGDYFGDWPSCKYFINDKEICFV